MCWVGWRHGAKKTASTSFQGSNPERLSRTVARFSKLPRCSSRSLVSGSAMRGTYRPILPSKKADAETTYPIEFSGFRLSAYAFETIVAGIKKDTEGEVCRHPRQIGIYVKGQQIIIASTKGKRRTDGRSETTLPAAKFAARCDRQDCGRGTSHRSGNH